VFKLPSSKNHSHRLLFSEDTAPAAKPFAYMLQRSLHHGFIIKSFMPSVQTNTLFSYLK